MIINLSVERSRSLTCLAAAQQFRANRVDTKDESMMIVAHGVARQVSRIAEGHEVLLPHIVLALRLVVNNMRDNKVIMIQRLRQRILGVSKQTLHSTEIDQRSEREREEMTRTEREILTQCLLLTIIEEQPVGWFLLRG